MSGQVVSSTPEVGQCALGLVQGRLVVHGHHHQVGLGPVAPHQGLQLAKCFTRLELSELSYIKFCEY